MNDRHGSRGRLWAFLRVLNVRLRFILLMVVTGLIAANWENLANHWERLVHPPSERGEAAASAVEHYCPMHPSVIRDEPGNCPICGMPLSERAKGEKPALPEGTLARVQLSPHRIQLAGVETSEVGYQALEPALRAVGTIEADERRLARISARVGGRIEKLSVNFTGERVAKGDPLAEIYSPELVSAQQEYLIALRGSRGGAGGSAGSQSDADILTAARRKLELWGIQEQQIAAIERDGSPSTTLAIRSPIAGIVTEKKAVQGMYVAQGEVLYTVADLGQVWMNAFLDPERIAAVAVGDRVDVTAQGSSSRIGGNVSFVYPVIDQASRKGKVRVDIPNPDGTLRPGMYVDAVLHPGTGAREAARSKPAREMYICPMHPEVSSDEPGTCPKCGMFLEKQVVPAGGGAATLVVPETAVIDTGTRKVVYLEQEPGVFDAIEVTLGPPSGGFLPVLQGLSPGARVVTHGTFLVDAEARLNPGAAGSYFGASGGPR